MSGIYWRGIENIVEQTDVSEASNTSTNFDNNASVINQPAYSDDVDISEQPTGQTELSTLQKATNVIEQQNNVIVTLKRENQNMSNRFNDLQASSDVLSSEFKRLKRDFENESKMDDNIIKRVITETENKSIDRIKELEKKVNELKQSNTKYLLENENLREEINKLKIENSNYNERLTKANKQIVELEEKVENYDLMKQRFDSVMGSSRSEIVEKDRQAYEKRIDELIKENEALKQERRYDEGVNNLIKDTANATELIKNYTNNLNDYYIENSRLKDIINKQSNEINSLKIDLEREKMNNTLKDIDHGKKLNKAYEDYNDIQKQMSNVTLEKQSLINDLGKYKNMEQRYNLMLNNIREQYKSERERINDWLNSNQLKEYFEWFRTSVMGNDDIVRKLLDYITELEELCAAALACRIVNVKRSIAEELDRIKNSVNTDGYIMFNNIPYNDPSTPYNIPELIENYNEMTE